MADNKIISTLDEYVKRVESICADWGALNTTTHPWYRGQRVADWHLVPGLYRGSVDPRLERELIREFQLKAGPYLKDTTACVREPATFFEWLFIMQHHGMPTRLLDWTESYLQGLFFAVSDYSEQVDACVWVLDPWALNKDTLKAESVPTYDHPALTKYECHQKGRKVLALQPAAIRPNHSTARIVAQSGVFTVHGSCKNGIDEQSIKPLKTSLKKIVIRGTAKLSLLRELNRSGIRESRVFPDLDGLSRELAFRFSKDYTTGHSAQVKKRKATTRTATRDSSAKKNIVKKKLKKKDMSDNKWTVENMPMIITRRSSDYSQRKQKVSLPKRRKWSETKMD